MAAYLPVGSLCAFLVFFFISRRRERSADAQAIALTGDPEALMTALAKLARLNLQPLDWGKWQEQWLTHPSMLRRSQTIARLGGVASERVPEILNAPEAEAEHYSIPTTARNDRQALSARPKNGVVDLRGLARLGIRVGLPLLVAYLLQTGLLEGASAGALAVAGLALTFVADQLLRGSLHISEYRNLQRQMAARLREEGLDPQSDNVVFIGFGPDPHPRVYESHDDWDAGFLVLASDRLCYIGDQTRFALKPEHIVDVRLGPGWPAWWLAHRVYVTWRDEERGTGGTFNFCPAPAHFEWQQSAAARRYQQTLEAWRARRESAFPLQPALPELETPSIGAVTGHSPATLASFRAMRASLIETLVAAYLLSAGLPDSYAWYVYAVSVAATIFADILFLLYRDPAPAEIASQPRPAEAVPGETRQSAGESGTSWLVRGASALGLGVVATVAGAALYYAAFRLTGWRLTLLAIPIGLGVGYAIKLGSRGVGGRGYRILAAYLTFVAVFVPDMVRVTSDMGLMLQGMNARKQYWPEPSAEQVQLAKEQTRELQAMPISERLMVFWPALMALPIAFAVMIFPYAFLYPLASIAVGAGMWLAWRQNRAPC